MFEIHANPDGKGWRALIDWKGRGPTLQPLQFTTQAAAEAVAARHARKQGHDCKVVPATATHPVLDEIPVHG